MRRIISTLALLTLCLTSSALAQDPQTARGQQDDQTRAAAEPASPVDRAMAWVESHHLIDWMRPRDPKSDGFWIRPRIGGITRGAGFAVGPDVIVPVVPQWLELHAFGSMSTRRYRFGLAEVVSPHLLKDHLVLSAGAAYRYFPEEDYWGVGPDSRGPQTSYLLESREYKAIAKVLLGHSLGVGATVGYLRPSVGTGRDRAFASTERVFTPELTPGLTARPEFQYGTVSIDFDTRDNPLLLRRGTRVQLAASRYVDRDAGRYTFTSLEAQALQVIPIFGDTRRLVLFGRAVSDQPDAGRDVPFYLMPWLGGDDTLRGEYTYRFRDRSLVQFNAEYQWRLFEVMDMAVFADAGSVAPRLQDFQAPDLKTAVGLGLRFHTSRMMALRIDAALGGTGTRRVMVRLRPSF